MSLTNKLIGALLHRLGIIRRRTPATYDHDGLRTRHNDSFRRESTFREAYERGIAASWGHDPQHEWRAHIALWAAATSLNVDGDFVECGVNAGFMSSAIMHHLDWNSVGRKFYLVDTFGGPVREQFTENERTLGRLDLIDKALEAGAYVTDLDRIRSNFGQWNDAVIVQGAVPGVLEQLKDTRVAFLHLDMNCVYPEQKALEFFWDRLTRNAIVLLDDYAYMGYEEQTAAIDEVVRERNARVLSLPTGQGLIVRG